VKAVVVAVVAVDVEVSAMTADHARTMAHAMVQKNVPQRLRTLQVLSMPPVQSSHRRLPLQRPLKRRRHSSQATTTASPAKSVRVTVMAVNVAPALTVETVVVSVVTALSRQSRWLP
jgi:hypothetical protein